MSLLMVDLAVCNTVHKMPCLLFLEDDLFHRKDTAITSISKALINSLLCKQQQQNRNLILCPFHLSYVLSHVPFTSLKCEL